MHRLILPLSICLTGCTTEYVYVKPDIPVETLTPCPISDRKVKTVNELATLATEHLVSAQCANGKLIAVADMLAE